MKILFVWPPEISVTPKHVDLPYHYVYLCEVASFLREKGEDVRLLDGQALNLQLESFIQEYMNWYDLVCICCRPHNVRWTVRLIELCSKVSRRTRILVYGDLCSYIPAFFKKHSVNAIVTGGDWESAIWSYVQHLNSGKRSVGCGKANSVSPMVCKKEFLSPEQWAFPDVSLVPLQAYKEMHGKGSSEVTLTVSRGCAFTCKFCTAPKTFGASDRRRSTESVVSYLGMVHEQFGSAKLFSPTLTVDREWVVDLCKRMVEVPYRIDWSGTSRPDCLLDEGMVEWMAASGCCKIAMGIESLDPKALKGISKNYGVDACEKAVRLLNKYHIRAKALVMLGSPQQTLKGIWDTFAKLEDMGAEIRPTAYSPYQVLTSKMSIDEIEQFDKRFLYYHKIEGLSDSKFLRLLHRPCEFREIVDMGVSP